jgi:hypothetical protein
VPSGLEQQHTRSGTKKDIKYDTQVEHNANKTKNSL